MTSSPASASASEILRVLAEGTAAVTGGAFFQSLAKHAALALGARYAFVSESISTLESRSLAYWEGSGFGEGFSYRFPGTPCERVAAGSICATPTRLRELFPEDVWLQQIGVDSYVGVPMKNAEGKVLGHIAVLHTEPMTATPEQIAVLQIFTARGCAELERVQAERALQEALEEVRRLKEQLEVETGYLQDEIRSNHNFDDMIGASPAWRRLLQQLDSIAAADSTVLIRGETGAGKELVARAIHQRGPRRERALVKVNCAAISPGLVESELFGHKKGAFTGAIQARIGRFELAHRGTLLLDEVGELPLDSQVRLLRILEERSFEALGSNASVQVDVRVIAATNRDLEQAVRDGTFRADLYYRLNVIPVHVPPLRERGDDVQDLALHFLLRASRRAGRPPGALSGAALERRKRYAWPGNVRELENLIERAVVLSRGATLEIDSLLPEPELGAPASTAPISRTAPTVSEAAAPMAAATPADEAERQRILGALEQANWVIEGSDGAAQLLALSPSTTRSRMKRLGIERSGGGR
jgi:transcriptional regulator with GAF, ATPase, and Fis domain